LATIPPYVRHMLLCDDVRADAGNARRVNLTGLASRLVADSFPAAHDFAVYLSVSGARGVGQVRIVVWDADSEAAVWTGPPHPVNFGADPLRIHALTFRIVGCVFPHVGLYWVEFVCDGVPLASEPLLLEQRG